MANGINLCLNLDFDSAEYLTLFLLMLFLFHTLPLAANTLREKERTKPARLLS
jgi:hypothetical protein